MRLVPYRSEGSVIHRLDPRVKLTALVLFCAAMLLFTDPVFLAIPLAACAAVAAAGRVLKAFALGAAMILAVGALSFLLWPLILGLRGQGGGEIWLFGLGMGMRLSAMLLAGLLLLFTTRMEEILAALGRMGVPFTAVFSLGLTFRLVPALLGEVFNVVDAQRLRGLKFNEGGLVKRVRRYIPLMVPILGGALRSAHRMSWALEAKGFGLRGRVPYLELGMRLPDWVALGLTLAAFAAAIWARLAGIGVLAGGGM